jgi:hypothetical protein
MKFFEHLEMKRPDLLAGGLKRLLLRRYDEAIAEAKEASSLFDQKLYEEGKLVLMKASKKIDAFYELRIALIESKIDDLEWRR